MAELDSNSIQSTLAQAITGLGAEVVYCGKTAADTGAGSTGPGVAERLGWASVSNITDATFDGGITVTTQLREDLQESQFPEMP